MAIAFRTALRCSAASVHRPCPSDFRAVYLDIGWQGIEEHFRANWRTICRWVDETGGEELIEARRQVVRQRQAEDRKRHLRRISRGHHLPGWSAERIEALRARQAA